MMFKCRLARERGEKNDGSHTDSVAAEVCGAYIHVLKWCWSYYTKGTTGCGWKHR